jgi:hypothetical protein
MLLKNGSFSPRKAAAASQPAIVKMVGGVNDLFLPLWLDPFLCSTARLGRLSTDVFNVRREAAEKKVLRAQIDCAQDDKRVRLISAKNLLSICARISGEIVGFDRAERPLVRVGQTAM